MEHPHHYNAYATPKQQQQCRTTNNKRPPKLVRLKYHVATHTTPTTRIYLKLDPDEKTAITKRLVFN